MRFSAKCGYVIEDRPHVEEYVKGQNTILKPKKKIRGKNVKKVPEALSPLGSRKLILTYNLYLARFLSYCTLLIIFSLLTGGGGTSL